jgi:hypothetical protein
VTSGREYPDMNLLKQDAMAAFISETARRTLMPSSTCMPLVARSLHEPIRWKALRPSKGRPRLRLTTCKSPLQVRDAENRIRGDFGRHGLISRR